MVMIVAEHKGVRRVKMSGSKTKGLVSWLWRSRLRLSQRKVANQGIREVVRELVRGKLRWVVQTSASSNGQGGAFDSVR